jgi:translocation and assembly module TamB
VKKKTWFLSLVAVIFVVLIACLACLAWLAGTTQGTRTIIGGLSRLSGFTGIRLEVEKVAGSLSREVLLEGISMRLSDTEVLIGSARLTCELFYLLAGKLAVQELSIRNMAIRDKRPDVEKPFDLAWPKVPYMLGRFDAWINTLDLSEVSYQRLDGEPVRFTRLAARVLWYQGVLHASSIHGSSDFGRIEGSLSAGLIRPGLDAALSLTPADQTGLSQVSISTHLTPALYPEELSGPVSMMIKPVARAEIRAASRFAVARQSIGLSKIEVSQKGRPGTIDAEGSVDFSSPAPRANLTARIHDLDLSPELKARTLVSGSVNVSSRGQSYTGRFSLDSKGESWSVVHLSGDIEGDLGQARLHLRKGSILGASVTGEIHAERGNGVSIEGSIQGRNFNPAALLPTWDGEINLDARGNLLIVDGRLDGAIAAAFPESKLRGHPLTGQLEVQLRKGVVSIPNFDVHAKGFDLSARGVLNEKITYDARIGDLSALFQEGKGRISANGWMRFAKGAISGKLQGSGSQVAFREKSISEFNVSLQAEQGTNGQLEARAFIKKAKHDPITIDSASLELRGSAQDHIVTCDVRWPEGKVAATARGAYREHVWQATLLKLDGNDRVSPWRLAENSSLLISARRVVVSRIMLAGAAGERLELSADMSFSPRKGFLLAGWTELNLARLQGILGKAAVSGNTTGSVRAELPDKGNPALSGAISATGKLSYRSVDVSITKANANLSWGTQGLQASWEINSADGTRLNGRASSTEASHASLPDRAKIEMTWDGMDLAALKAWLSPPSKPAAAAGYSRASTKRATAGPESLPAGFDIQGRLSGNLSGELLPGRQVNIRGETSLAQGVVAWRGAEGLIRTTVEQAKAGWTWRGENVTGNVALALSGYGHLEASFQLPITARIPPVIERDGPIRISVTGEVRERGLLTAFFPGLIQESSGHLRLDVSGNGTWSKPALNGRIRLAQAGAYLPSAGIQLKDVEAEAEFVEDQIRVTSFTLRSGKGQIHGKATIRLKDWKMDRYEGSLQGESFQTVYLPELQILTNPELTFEGTTKKVAVRGTIRIPDFLLRHPETQNLVRPNSDIVIVGGPAKQAPGAPFNLDAEVNAILGDRVKVQAMGIDAQLGGALLLLATSIDDVTAKGEIRVIKGQYASAGVKLDITRGRIIFSGGPPDKAALDIVATRKIQQVATPGRLGTREEVLVGVNVGGTVSSPAVKLYSDPAMADPQILSYIVFGRLLSPGTEQSALLSQAATTLLAAGPSSGIQQRLKGGLGIDSIDIVDVAQSSSTTGSSGSATPPGGGSSSSTGSGSVTRSLVTVGKYLSPQFYVSLGHSLSTGENLMTARYRLSKHWEVESKSGTQVGADLFYRIEFE